MRVAPEDGRMLATSARKADACAALLVGDTGFHTKGTGTAMAVCSFMTSTHKWPNLESSLSRPVLPLLGCRPPMIVRVAPEGGRMQRALSLFVRSCGCHALESSPEKYQQGPRPFFIMQLANFVRSLPTGSAEVKVKSRSSKSFPEISLSLRNCRPASQL